MANFGGISIDPEAQRSAIAHALMQQGGGGGLTPAQAYLNAIGWRGSEGDFYNSLGGPDAARAMYNRAHGITAAGAAPRRFDDIGAPGSNFDPRAEGPRFFEGGNSNFDPRAGDPPFVDPMGDYSGGGSDPGSLRSGPLSAASTAPPPAGGGGAPQMGGGGGGGGGIPADLLAMDWGNGPGRGGFIPGFGNFAGSGALPAWSTYGAGPNASDAVTGGHAAFGSMGSLGPGLGLGLHGGAAFEGSAPMADASAFGGPLGHSVTGSSLGVQAGLNDIGQNATAQSVIDAAVSQGIFGTATPGLVSAPAAHPDSALTGWGLVDFDAIAGQPAATPSVSVTGPVSSAPTGYDVSGGSSSSADAGNASGLTGGMGVGGVTGMGGTTGLGGMGQGADIGMGGADAAGGGAPGGGDVGGGPGSGGGGLGGGMGGTGPGGGDIGSGGADAAGGGAPGGGSGDGGGAGGGGGGAK